LGMVVPIGVCVFFFFFFFFRGKLIVLFNSQLNSSQKQNCDRQS